MNKNKEIGAPNKSGLSKGNFVPIVSVIMPAYNAERFIGESIGSVKAQSEERWELIVIDDASTDTTSEIVCAEAESDDRISYLRTDGNKGPSFARNLGIEHSRGEFIAFLDSDDLMSPDALSLRIKVLEDNPTAGGSYCDSPLINEDGESLNITTNHKQQIVFNDLMENRFPTSLVILRAALLKKVGGFDNDIRYGEDWDLWLRLTRSGARFMKADGCRVYYRQYQASLTHERLFEDYEERMTVLERAWGEDPLCKAPLKEFKNGLGDALKNTHRTARAFASAVAEVVNEDNETAARFMTHVSLDLLCLMEIKDLVGRCKFLIKRNLCIDEGEWASKTFKFNSLFYKFLDDYKTDKSSLFFDKFAGELFMVKFTADGKVKPEKISTTLLGKFSEKLDVAVVAVVKRICKVGVVSKMLGMVFWVTSRLNNLVGLLYSVKND